MSSQFDIPLTRPISFDKLDARFTFALAKHGLTPEEVLSQVCLVGDVSPSMEFPHRLFYSLGIMDGLVRRVYTISKRIDRDKVCPCVRLDAGASLVRVPIREDNIDGYVAKYLANLGSGTHYAPSINTVMSNITPGKHGDPGLAFVFTDGENFDTEETEQALIAASDSPVFFQFFGITSEDIPKEEWPRHFPQLSRLDKMEGRRIDNAGFAVLNLHTITDAALFDAMFIEYPQFLAQARAQGMLPWKRRGLFGRR